MTLIDFVLEIKDFLFEPKEILISINVFTLIIGVLFLIYLVKTSLSNLEFQRKIRKTIPSITLKFVMEKGDSKIKGIEVDSSYPENTISPTGWKWNEEKKLWEPPEDGIE